MGVVVDVRLGVQEQMLHQEVDKNGEGLLLFGAVMRPKVTIDPFAVVSDADAKEVFEAVFLQRVALHIEKQITFVRGWQAIKPGRLAGIAGE